MHNNALLPHTPKRSCTAQRHQKRLRTRYIENRQRAVCCRYRSSLERVRRRLLIAPHLQSRELPDTPAAWNAGHDGCDAQKGVKTVREAGVLLWLMGEMRRACVNSALTGARRGTSFGWLAVALAAIVYHAGVSKCALLR